MVCFFPLLSCSQKRFYFCFSPCVCDLFRARRIVSLPLLLLFFSLTYSIYMFYSIWFWLTSSIPKEILRFLWLLFSCSFCPFVGLFAYSISYSLHKNIRFILFYALFQLRKCIWAHSLSIFTSLGWGRARFLFLLSMPLMGSLLFFFFFFCFAFDYIKWKLRMRARL